MSSLYTDEPRARYHRDPEFHALVDYMRAMIHRAQFSPSELREAAILAAIMYEETNPRAIQLRSEDQ